MDSIEKCNSITHTLKFLNSNPNLFFNNKSKLFAVQISAPYPHKLKPNQSKANQSEANQAQRNESKATYQQQEQHQRKQR